MEKASAVFRQPFIANVPKGGKALTARNGRAHLHIHGFRETMVVVLNVVGLEAVTGGRESACVLVGMKARHVSGGSHLRR